MAEAGSAPRTVGATIRVRLAGKRSDNSLHGYFTDRMVEVVGDEQISAAIDREAEGRIESRSAADTIRATTIARRTCNRGDSTARGNLPNRVIIRVSDEHIAAAVHRDAAGSVETRGAANAVYAART